MFVKMNDARFNLGLRMQPSTGWWMADGWAGGHGTDGGRMPDAWRMHGRRIAGGG